MSGPERLDIASLLTIDVESELRKLTQAQLQGPWQLPAELVRRALRAGATRVEVEIGRQELRVSSDGGGVPMQVLRELAALLDPKRAPERRHRALSELERVGALSLLGLVGLSPTSLRILSPAPSPGGEGIGLSWRNGVVETQRFKPPGPARAEVVVRGAKLDRARAREWLANVARHAPVEIVVDGEALDRHAGFDDAFAIRTIISPLAATIALPREGDVARLYLLQDGLVTTQLSIPDAPCFEAAIETRGLAEPGASAARLRELIQPLVASLVSAAVTQMSEIVNSGVGLATRDRARLTQLLLQAARCDRDLAKSVARLPLFRGLERDGRERWVDLLALRQSVQDEGGERLLTALFPDQDPAEFAPEARIYVLDERERALLGAMLELGFRQPRRRVEARRGFARLWHEGPQFVHGHSLLAALRPGGRPIPDAALSPDERGLLVQLRAQLDRCEIWMCTGTGPVRRIGPGPDKLLLPRESARVKSAVIAVGQDPSWIYPALLALLDGHAFPERARKRWAG